MNHNDILKATQDFLGDMQEDHSQHPRHESTTLKRELDSLDDFEHLGHDSSPITETKTAAADNVSGTRDTHQSGGKIDTGYVRRLGDDVPHIDPQTQHRPDSIPHQRNVPMDSNLLQMGGDTFPDRKEADDKLDKFLSGSSPSSAIRDHVTKDIFDDFKADAVKFSEELEAKPSAVKIVDDLLERFSDSDEDSKPSNVTNDSFPSYLHGLPPQIDPVKSEQTFKDFDEFVDYTQHKIEEMPDRPAKEDSFEKFEGELKSEPILIHPEPVVKASSAQEEKPKEMEAPKIAISETKAVIEAEAMFCKMGLDAWFNPERLDPQVESLIYWRDPKKSGPVFGGVLVVLLALTYFSLISVVAYLSLLGLTATISFRIYKNIVQAVQKTGDGHPFKEYLEWNMALPQDKVDELCKITVAHLNAGVTELRRLFLVEDLVDSIKFGVFLWCMTYLGAWFNGMTLIILAWVALFSLPKVYETNKTQIDANLDIVRSKLADITSKVKAAVPIGKKSDEKKE